MNFYIRYFDSEILVDSLQKVIDFLQSIPEIDVDEYMVKELTQYAASSNQYPRRFKVKDRAYFIVIKTLANTMEEFKENGAQQQQNAEQRAAQAPMNSLEMYRPGWYQCRIVFKRVIPIPQTMKFQYVDTTFVARVKAVSAIDSYNRIMDHLHSRADIDQRCQFPSAKGKNFEYVYQGME